MKRHLETIISIAVVALAIIASVLKEDKPQAPTPNGETTIHSPQEISVITETATPRELKPITDDMSLTDKKQRCEKNSAQANQAIKESLELIQSLDPNNQSERVMIDQHMELIAIAKNRLTECQELVQDYEQQIESLENKIKSLQSTP